MFHHIETSHLTGFYMMGALVVKRYLHLLIMLHSDSSVTVMTFEVP